MADNKGLKSEVMKLAWQIQKSNAQVVDAIEEQGKENKLEDKENKKEQNLFFSKLFSKMTNALKPKAGLLGKVNPGILAKGVAVALLALPAMAGALIAGFIGPAVAAIKKLPGVVQLTSLISKIGGKIPLLGKLFGFIGAIIRGPGRFIDDLIRVFPIFGKVLGVFKTVGSIFGKVFFPLTLLIGAIEGGIAAFKEYESGGTISEVLLAFLDGFVSSLTFGLVDIRVGFKENMRRILDGIIEYGGKAIDWIATNVPYYIGVLGDELAFFFQFTLPNSIRDMIDGVINWFSGEGESGMIGDMLDFIADLGETIGSVLYEMGVAIGNTIAGFVRGFGRLFMDFGYYLVEKIAEVQVAVTNYINSTRLGDLIIDDDFAEAQEAGLKELQRLRKERTDRLNKEDAELEKQTAEEMKARKEAREKERELRKEARAAMRAEREAMLAARRPAESGTSLRDQQRRATEAQNYVMQQDSIMGPPAPSSNVNTFINTENNNFSTPPMILQDPAFLRPMPIIA